MSTNLSNPRRPNSTLEHLINVDQAAQVMDVSSKTVRRLIKSGNLPACRVGRSYRLRPSSVNSFLDRSKATPAQDLDSFINDAIR